MPSPGFEPGLQPPEGRMLSKLYYDGFSGSLHIFSALKNSA